MLNSKIFVRVLCLLSLTTSVFANNDLGYKVPTLANEIKIMSYNAENLFDNEHDAGKKDYEFLPKAHPMKQECEKDTNESRKKYCLDTDWTTDKFKIKIAQMKQAVQAAGTLPDILGLTEVENLNAARPLATALGYDGVVITESPDARGIDNVILYKKTKLDFVGFIDREIKNPLFPTRNISVAHFKFKKAFGVPGVLGVYPNHWPSQASPTKARTIVAEQLVAFVNENRTKHKGQDYYAVVIGDFNTIVEDIPNPIDDVVLDKSANLIDVQDLSNNSQNPMNGKMPPASYFYAVKSQWNELDRIFVSTNLNDKKGVEVEPTSFRIHAPSFLTKKADTGEAIPYRYNHRADNPSWAGYSDHFALVVKISIKK